MGFYSIVKKGDDLYHLYERGDFLTSFSRLSFQSDLGVFAENSSKSQNWIGSILRLFNSKFPSPKPVYLGVSPEDRLLSYRDDYLVDYLRSKGFRVVKRVCVADSEIIAHLEKHGYSVEGLLNDCFYSSEGVVNGG